MDSICFWYEQCGVVKEILPYSAKVTLDKVGITEAVCETKLYELHAATMM